VLRDKYGSTEPHAQAREQNCEQGASQQNEYSVYADHEELFSRPIFKIVGISRRVVFRDGIADGATRLRPHGHHRLLTRANPFALIGYRFSVKPKYASAPATTTARQLIQKGMLKPANLYRPSKDDPQEMHYRHEQK
jgi:hypothetical protein